MRAYRLAGPAAPLNLVEIPDPKPGAGQVVVDIKAATLNYRDTIVQEGRYSDGQRAELIPLSDGAGVISAVGDGVPHDRIGERVVIGFMPNWIEGPFSAEKQAGALGGGFVDGVLAERIAVPADGVVRIPDDWSYEEAAAYPCAGVTAWNCLFGGRGIRPGSTVLLQGTGGVSTFALQFARAAGARVIVTSSSDEKLSEARALGAEAAINYRNTADWGTVAAKTSGEEGVDLVVEVGGSGTLNQALSAVRRGGEIALVGVLTGFSGEINTSAILMKGVNVRGVYVGSLADLREAMRSGVRPFVQEIFAFEQANQAYARLRSGAHRGKIAIRVAD
ncbi:NAD(P)-dependent alcohol dehydrogenase [Mesorhizobium sp. RMAD-H1]|uniref:zinc-dependent alcohol dehydrogenase family protein n=1 Tax=Mesorhizobium sp. RMAD-H1 TaxID=2587065 RepID=UPI0016106AF3|nr:NAD(P)-dependent alcohol dehydrogenase [Mesorhizobium sp. RMAD-H1]MBB2971441.1 NADPH:quinone reductase-like Zn-dependent oxidoreductase [Mesorhizobium sp. RMAD-H1]